MEIRGIAELTVRFSENDLQEIQVGDRMAYRLGPLFVPESLAQELVTHAGRITRLAVKLRARQSQSGQTFLSAVVTDVVSMLPEGASKQGSTKPQAPAKSANGKTSAKPQAKLSLAKRLAG